MTGRPLLRGAAPPGSSHTRARSLDLATWSETCPFIMGALSLARATLLGREAELALMP